MRQEGDGVVHGVIQRGAVPPALMEINATAGGRYSAASLSVWGAGFAPAGARVNSSVPSSTLP